MSTVHYRNAVILVDGYLLSGTFAELGVQYGCEVLDETAFGDTTRIHKAGLLTASVDGRGHLEFGVGSPEAVLFNAIGVDGTVLLLFPDGITEGSATNRGFGMLSVVNVFEIGGQVGTILPFRMSAASRGIEP